MKKKSFNFKGISRLCGLALVLVASTVPNIGSYLLFGEPKAPKSLIK